MFVAKIILEPHTKNIFEVLIGLALVKRIGDRTNLTVAAKKVDVVGPMLISLRLCSYYRH